MAATTSSCSSPRLHDGISRAAGPSVVGDSQLEREAHTHVAPRRQASGPADRPFAGGQPITWLAAQPAPAAAHPGHPPSAQEPTKDLRRARAATRKFRNVAVARAAGYTATGKCTQDPKYGGMGIHYANEELVADGKLDVTSRRSSSTSRHRAASCGSARSSTSRRTPTRTSPPTPTGPTSSECRSTGRCSATRRGCRSTTTCTCGSTATTPPAGLRCGTPACTAQTPAGPRRGRSRAHDRRRRRLTHAALAAKSCKQVPYSERTQARAADGRPNAAGVVFQPEGDRFKVWDNLDDGKPVDVYFNYAGVADKWKFVISPVDGHSTSVIRNLKELQAHLLPGADVGPGLAGRPLHDEALTRATMPPRASRRAAASAKSGGLRGSQAAAREPPSGLEPLTPSLRVRPNRSSQSAIWL